MANKENNGSGDAMVASSNSEPSELGELSELDALEGLGLEATGLGEVDPQDLQTAYKVFNFSGRDRDGNQIPKDAFYDTVDETAQPLLKCALLGFTKTNEYKEFTKTQGTRLICRSNDQITGTMSGDGRRRPCNGCEDAQWYQRPDGQWSKKCSEVYTVAGVELESQREFFIKFKSTSVPPFLQYLNRYFINRWVKNGTKNDVPLFVFQTNITLKMADSGIYSFPAFERGPMLDRDLIVVLDKAAVRIEELFSARRSGRGEIDAQVLGSSDESSVPARPQHTEVVASDFANGKVPF